MSPGVERIGGSLEGVWGTNPATGRPFTQQEWNERFLQEDGHPRWPGNDGAVPGRRVEFTDPDEFQAIYGSQMDRVGGISGDFLGIPPGLPFAQRSLPPGHLNRELHEYEFSGHLPEGLTIEVSEIAPAFGRPGGGIQVRFMEGTRAVPIEELLPAAPGADAPFAGVLR